MASLWVDRKAVIDDLKIIGRFKVIGHMKLIELVSHRLK